MAVVINYRYRPSKEEVRRAITQAMPIVQQKVLELVQRTAEEYLRDLEQHMGTISGTSSYRDQHVAWEELDEDTAKDAPKFWYKSGEAKRSLIVNIRESEGKVAAFVGIPESSDDFQKVLWNELGFTPKDNNKLVRRPLFLPLAAEHVDSLKNRVRQVLSNITVEVKV